MDIRFEVEDHCVPRISVAEQILTLKLQMYLISRRSSIGTFMRTSQSSQSDEYGSKKQKNPPQPKLDYRSMVSIDDMPALFVSFDSK